MVKFLVKTQVINMLNTDKKKLDIVMLSCLWKNIAQSAGKQRKKCQQFIAKEEMQINKTVGEIIKSITNFMSPSSNGAPENK